MAPTVLCLRPEADFARVEALPPPGLDVVYRPPDDPALGDLVRKAIALVIPAVGPKLPVALFEGTALRLVQVTGAGVDRLDRAALKRLRIPVANVPGGSSSAVAEYAVTAASLLLRCFVSADAGAATTRVIVRTCLRKTCPASTDCSWGSSASARSAERWRRRSETWDAESDTSIPMRTLQ